MKRSVTADRVQEIMVFGLLSFKCLFVVCFIFGMTYAGLSHDVRSRALFHEKLSFSAMRLKCLFLRCGAMMLWMLT